MADIGQIGGEKYITPNEKNHPISLFTDESQQENVSKAAQIIKEIEVRNLIEQKEQGEGKMEEEAETKQQDKIKEKGEEKNLKNNRMQKLNFTAAICLIVTVVGSLIWIILLYVQIQKIKEEGKVIVYGPFQLLTKSNNPHYQQSNIVTLSSFISIDQKSMVTFIANFQLLNLRYKPFFTKNNVQIENIIDLENESDNFYTSDFSIEPGIYQFGIGFYCSTGVYDPFIQSIVQDLEITIKVMKS